MPFNRLLLLSLLLASSLHAEEARLDIEAPADVWKQALPLGNRHQTALVLDAPERIRLRGFAGAWVKPDPFTAGHLSSQTATLLEKKPEPPHVELRIDCPGTEAAAQFTRRISFASGARESTFRLGSTRITRTLISPETGEAIFLHVIADQPGALSFQVSLVSSHPSDVRIEDRRQLVLTSKNPAHGGLNARVWVLPFESDVASEGDSILLKGEGEALIVFGFAKPHGGLPSLEGILDRLAALHDPQHQSPDPSKIWRGMLRSMRSGHPDTPPSEGSSGPEFSDENYH